jgi:DNA polymerase III subunit delta'
LKFSDIYAQQEPKNNLITAVNNGRIPHAQLFTSKEGNSSLALAIAYAQYVACIDKQLNDSCGVCSSCIKYQTLTHPDLHFTFPFFGDKNTNSDVFIVPFRKAFLENNLLSLQDWQIAIKGEGKNMNINVNECRNIFKKLALKPYESEYKILILWLPEFLGKEGNILLKLLEEPNPKTIFILVSEAQDKILTTIISRTQLVKLNTYSYNEIDEYLQSNHIAEGERAKNIAMMAEGNLNLALKLTQEMENPLYDIFRQWLLDCYTGNMANVMKFSEDISKESKDTIKNFLSYGLHIVRAALVVNHQNLENKLTQNENEFAKKLSQFYTRRKCQRHI